MKKKFNVFSFLNLLCLGPAIILLTISCSSTSEKNSEANKGVLLYEYGTQKMMNKEYTEALDLLTKAYEIDSKNGKTLNNLAMAYYFKGQKNKAKNLWVEALEIDEKHDDAR